MACSGLLSPSECVCVCACGELGESVVMLMSGAGMCRVGGVMDNRGGEGECECERECECECECASADGVSPWSCVQ